MSASKLRITFVVAAFDARGKLIVPPREDTLLLSTELCSVWTVNVERGKCKGSSLDIAPLTILESGALQPRKWQLTGIGGSTAAQASGCP